MLCFTLAARAQVKPSALFSDHMVLQSGTLVPIWGTATPGEKVAVTLNGQTRSATADAEGKWIVSLYNLKSGGPFEMTIAGDGAGDAPIVVKDVLVGEVWLGSGQSNMQFNVSAKGHPPYGLINEDKEIAAANYPQLRMFTAKNATAYDPQSDVVGTWQVCTPQTVPDWSAVGYLFGRDLNQALKLPVGIVLSAFGASTAEAWIPRDALAADPLLKPMLDKLDAREIYFKAHPNATTDADAPPSPQTINARPGRPGPLRDPAHDQHQPTVLYNAMINPIVPYAIRHPVAQALARRRLPVLRRPVARPGERQQQPSHPRAAGQDSIPAQYRNGRRARHWRNSQCPPQEQGAAGRGPEQDRPGQCLWPQDRVLRAGLRIQQSREQRDSR
jgi:sialate O-acetylesterase